MGKIKQIKEKLKRINMFTNRIDLHGSIKDIRQLSFEALALIDEMEKEDKFTVKVEIPKPDKNGGCSINCPGYSLLDGHCWNNLQAKKKEYPYCQPGPGCPRFKG